MIQVIIVGLAAWRVASLLVHEDGPYDIFKRFRRLIGIPETGKIEGVLPTLFTCVWCTSIWLAAAFMALWYVHWLIPGIAASASIAVAMERWARG